MLWSSGCSKPAKSVQWLPALANLSAGQVKRAISMRQKSNAHNTESNTLQSTLRAKQIQAHRARISGASRARSAFWRVGREALAHSNVFGRAKERK